MFRLLAVFDKEEGAFINNHLVQNLFWSSFYFIHFALLNLMCFQDYTGTLVEALIKLTILLSSLQVYSVLKQE